MACKVLEKANPNRHGWVRLEIELTQADGLAWYCVTTPDDRDTGREFEGDYKAAKAFFDKEVSRLFNLPNWEAQAAYDAEWGTVNGYGAHQYGREF